ncbi:MAG: SGNH/GDSL hydrolase family protein, partial [Planctomycetota bacterium]
PDDPLQSPPKDYERQLQEIVDKLKATKAKLIFCTTTPVPQGCKPLRETTSPAIYNQIGIRIAEKNGIAINDLYHYAESRLEEIQIPSNVHFTPKGSEILAMKVTESIRAAIQP